MTRKGCKYQFKSVSMFPEEFNHAQKLKTSIFEGTFKAHKRQVQSLGHNALSLKLRLSVISPKYTYTSTSDLHVCSKMQHLLKPSTKKLDKFTAQLATKFNRLWNHYKLTEPGLKLTAERTLF